MKKALIVIDLQYDFCEGGSMQIEGSNQIIPIINNLFPSFDLVIFTKEWHPYNMNIFESQYKGKIIKNMPLLENLLPDHCIKDTPGSRLHEGIDFSLIRNDFYIFKRGIRKNYHPYSVFEETNLANFLKKKNISDIYIVGLEDIDFRIKFTALDSIKRGFKTNVILTRNKSFNNYIIKNLETKVNIIYKDFIKN